MDAPPPDDPHAAKRHTADDALDAITGLDLRAWATVRDLCLRPWTVIQHSVFDHGTRYVGAVKLAFVLASLSALFAVLVPEALRQAPPEIYSNFDAGVEWGLVDANSERAQPLGPTELAKRKAQLSPISKLVERGISEEFFLERFMQKLQIITVFLSLTPALLFAFVHRRFEPRYRWIQHLNLIYYLTSLELIIALLLVPVMALLTPEPPPTADIRSADLDASYLYMLAAVIVSPLVQFGIRMPAIVRFFPASAARQVVRGMIVFTLLLLTTLMITLVSTVGSMLWTLKSFGV